MKLKQILLLVVLGLIASVAGFFHNEIIKQFRELTKGGDDSETTEAGKGEELTGPFVRFGRTVVNLKDESLKHYFIVDITLETKDARALGSRDAEKTEKEDVEKLLKRRKPILQSWLIGHLADKTIQEIGGKAGVEQLRQEIEDNFNRLLFVYGRPRIVDIHFEEYVVEE